MKYSEATPIRIRPVGAWQVDFRDGPGDPSILMIVDQLTPVEEVIEIVRNRHPGRRFEVRQIWAGEFVIDHLEHAYSADGRKVTSEGEVTL